MPMVILSGVCLFIGLFSSQVLLFLDPVFKTIMAQSPFVASLQPAFFPLSMISRVGAGLILAVFVLAVVKNKMLKRRIVEKDSTWGCGYSRPTARIQYTASSFANPIVSMFDSVLCPEKKITADPGLFPTNFMLETHPKDIFMHRVYRPVFFLIEYGALKLHWLQRGYNQLYILYIVITMLALLFWILWL